MLTNSGTGLGLKLKPGLTCGWQTSKNMNNHHLLPPDGAGPWIQALHCGRWVSLLLDHMPGPWWPCCFSILAENILGPSFTMAACNFLVIPTWITLTVFVRSNGSYLFLKICEYTSWLHTWWKSLSPFDLSDSWDLIGLRGQGVWDLLSHLGCSAEN